MWKKLSCLLSLVLLTVLSGCGGGGSDDLPPLVPASGTVTLDGKPLPDAEISFHPLGMEKGIGSLAYSDSEGKFIVRTSTSDGAAVREYKVTVVKNAKEDGSPLTAEEKADPALAIVSNILAKQYEDVEQTPLKVTIGEEGNESIKLELDSANTVPGAGGVGNVPAP